MEMLCSKIVNLVRILQFQSPNRDKVSKGANCVSATGISQLTMNNCKVKFGKQYGVYLAGKASG